MNGPYLVRRILSNFKFALLFVLLITLFVGGGILGVLAFDRGSGDSENSLNGSAKLPSDSGSQNAVFDQTLTVNAPLVVNGDLNLTPTALPQNAQAGQIVYDKDSNTLKYYDGTKFVEIAATSAIPVVSNNTVTGGVTSLQGQTGAVTLISGNGIAISGTTISNSGILDIVSAPNGIGVSKSGGTATLSLPQDLHVAASPTFAGLTVNGGASVGGNVVMGTASILFSNNIQQTAAGQDITINAGSDDISFTAGGRTFMFPTSGPSSQTICTTGIACASGGGQAVLLAPGSAQTDTSSDVAIFINDTGGGNLIQLQNGGTDRFVVASNGDTTIGGILNVNTITPTSTFTVGAFGQQFALQGTNASTISARNGANTTTVGFVTPTANTTLNFPALSAGTYQICTTSGNCLGGAGGATTALDNLASVAINTSLLSGSATIDLGSNANPFRDLYLGGTATNNIRFTGTATAARTITVPDASGTIAVSASGNIALSGAGNITFTGTLPIANGGTNASSAGAARTNLGAAASGANADITSTTALNTITPSGSLVIGATGQQLTLQGSGATVLTATASGSTTTVGFVTPTANATINFPALSAGTYQVCTTSGNCLGGGSGGANTALSNLSSVAINTSLLPGSTSIDLGAGATPFRDLYLGGTATNNFRFTGTATAARTITLPDASGTLAVSASGNIALSAAGNISFTGTLPIANGGTNTTATPTQGGVAYGTGTAYAFSSAGSSNQVLISNGTSAPSFANISSLLTSGSNISLTGTTNVTVATVANPTFATSVTTPLLQSSGTLTITPGGDLTVGDLGQQFTLQGTETSTVAISNGSFSTTIGFVDPTADATINVPALGAGTYQFCTTSGNCLGGGSGGANTALSNLSSVAINTSLLTGSSTIDLGSGANPFRDVYIGGTATNNFKVTGTATAARTITLPDATGTVCLDTGNCVGGGGGSAPNGATYITVSSDGTLSAERVLTAGTNLSVTDGGANSTITVATVNNPTFSTSVTTPILQSSGTLTITPSGALTVGATGQQFTLQGSSTSTITSTNGANKTTLAFGTISGNQTVTIPNETGTICTTAASAACLSAYSGSGVSSIGSIDSQTKSANGAVIVGTVLYMQTADASNPGLVSTGTQTFAGAKTFNNNVTVASAANLTVTAGATSLTGLAAGTSTALNVVTGATTNVGMIIQGASSQTADLLQIKDSGGNVELHVDAAGAIDTMTYINTPNGGIGYSFNLLNDTEDLTDTGSWTQSNITSVTADTTTSPAHDTTADTVVSSGSGTHSLTQTYTTSTNGTYTYSIYARTISGSQPIQLRIDSTGATPTTGTAASFTATTTWQRFSVTQAFTGTPSNIKAVLLITNNSATIVGWGAQLMEGASAGVYTPYSQVASGASIRDTLVVTKDATAGRFTFDGVDNFVITSDAVNGAIVQFRDCCNATFSVGGTGVRSSFAYGLDVDDGLTVSDTSATAFNVINGSSNEVLTVDTSANRVVLGKGSTLAGQLVFQNATNANTATIVSGAQTGNRQFTIPVTTGNDTFCLVTLNNCTGAGATTVGAIDSQTKSANGAVISAGTLYMQTADASNPGLVSTGTQTFAGAKTFNAAATLSGASSNLTFSGVTTDITTGTNEALTISPNGSGDIVLSVDNDTNVQVTGTVTDTGNAQAINLTLGNDANADIVSGLTVNVTSANTGDADDVYGINIADLSSPDGTVYEAGLAFGGGWDDQIYFGDLSTHISVLNSGFIQFSDDAANVLMTISDAGTTGNVSITGALTVDNITPGANLTIGTSDTTGTLLVIDTKTGSGDPTGVNGGIYYNSNSAKFRCYENSTWKDCITAGGSGVTTIGTIDSQTKSANGAVITGTSLVMQTADASNPGLVSTGTQTFAGNKTLTGATTLSGASANLTFSGVTTDITTGTNEALTVAPNGTGDVIISGDDDSQLQVTGTVTSGTVGTPGALQTINVTLGNDADADIVTGLSINATSATTGDADNLIGLYVGNVTSTSASVVEIGALIGNGWDTNLYFNDTSTIIQFADGATTTFMDDVGNALLVLVDTGTAGDVGVTGNLGAGTASVNYLVFSGASAGQNPTISTNSTEGINILGGGGTVVISNDGVGTVELGTPFGGQHQTITIGATSGGSTSVNGGTLNLQSGANITLGTSNTTGTLLVLDTKTGSGDPTGVNGGMYYNSNSSKFRCFEASSWKDCITAGVTTIGTIDSQTKSANGAVISGTSLVLQTADASSVGLVSTGTQTFAGNKTLTGATTLSGASANLTFSGVTTDITTGTNEALTVSPNGSGDVVFSVDNDTDVQITGTVTDTGNAQTVNVTLGNDAGVDTVSGITVNATSTATGDADTLIGLNVANLTGADATVKEYGVNIGSGWDANLFFNDTTTNIQVANTGTIVWADDAGNALLTVADGGTAGNVTISGTLTVANITPSANLTIGTSDTTGTLLVLDTKTGSGDPTGVNGGMYYNSNSGKFRCYQNSSWQDCIAAGASLFTDGGAFTYLTSTTDELVIGANTSQGAKLSVVGTSDEVQLYIAANATQTNPLIYVDDSAGNELFRLTTNDNTSLFLGFEAGESSGLVGGNTAIGSSALNANTTGTGNVAVGFGTLQSSVTGSINVAIGGQAMGAADGGASNIALGFQALYNNTGDNNIALGQTALLNNGAGGNNVALGYRALIDNSTGGDNIAIGADALNDNDGDSNVAIGSGAASDNSSGTRNVSLGYQSMIFSEGGTENLGLGYQSLRDNGGDHNVGVGSFSLQENATGNDNVAIGQAALAGNSAGSNNTALGSEAMRFSEGGTYNISLGYQSLLNGQGDFNIVIGKSSGATITTGDSNILIGVGVDVTSATGNNQLNIAGILTSSDYTTGNLVVGTSDTTGQLLVLDTKTGSGDPTGVAGGMYYNSNYGKMRCYEGTEWRFCSDPTSLSQGYDWREDWLNGQQTAGQIGDLGWTVTATGTGAQYSQTGATDADHVGVGDLNTGTTSTGAVDLYINGSFSSIIIGSNMVMEFGANIPSSTSGQRHNVRLGLGDVNGADYNNGIYFQYSDNLNSGNWVCTSANGGTRSNANSGTAVTAAWHRFKIVMNSAGTSAECFVDGTSLGTLSTNLPTGTTTPHFQIVKSVGTTAKDLKLDYMELRRNITGGR